MINAWTFGLNRTVRSNYNLLFKDEIDENQFFALDGVSQSSFWQPLKGGADDIE